MDAPACNLKKQGFTPGDCLVKSDGKRRLACQATLKTENKKLSRKITSIHLSRPENYLSIYQSGCNFACRKCHSWSFSKVADGSWYTAEDILKYALEYQEKVSWIEPRDKATSYHAHNTCRCCGHCVLNGKPSAVCPGVLDPEAIVISPQGFGPVRNIVGFTGGDVTCCPEFYGECTRLIKAETRLWVLIETNGYGLTSKNLDYLKDSGVDAFWLDIKAHDPDKHKWLTGCSNDRILNLPEEIISRGFVLEVLSLYIPGLIETDELERIAGVLYAVDPSIPFTVLAFFPEYKMTKFKSPCVKEMVATYHRIKSIGLQNVRLGNLGVFAPGAKDRQYLMENVSADAY
jgi:pyruvate-formate lyase-activating enzyme